jgi:O-antigen ligase
VNGQLRKPWLALDQLAVEGPGPALIRAATYVAIPALAALAAGVAATSSHHLALIAFITAVVGVTWLVLAPGERRMLLLAGLVIVVFNEGISIGGISADRLASPIALLFIAGAFVVGDRLPFGTPLYWVTLYALWAVASGLWTTNAGRTFTVLLSLSTALVFMAAFAMFVKSRAVLEWVLYAIVATAFVVGIIGSVTFLQGTVERSRGTVGDYNFFAAYELFALPLAIALLGAIRNIWALLAVGAAVLAIIAGILTTLSRGGALALGVTLIIILIWPAWRLFPTPGYKATLILVAVLGTVAIVTVPQQKVLPRLTSVFSQKDTGSGRVNAWLAARTSIKERPFLGLGYGGFEPAANDLMRRTPGVDLVDFDLRQKGLEPHNVFIGTTAELGIPGLVFFVGILVSTGVAFRRSARRARQVGSFFLMRVCNALILSLIGWCVASIFLSSETNKPLWVMIGLALALPSIIEREAREASVPPRER